VSKDSNEIVSNAPPPPLPELAVTVVTIPVPLSATVCVPAPLPALTFSVAVADPAEAGSNTTLIVQFAPTCERGAARIRLRERLRATGREAMLVIGSATPPVFVTVTDCGALATLVSWLPNASEAGDTV
jgi:hypothetical protein